MLERLNGGCDDGCQAFFVDWTLYRDVRELSILEASWQHSGVVAGVLIHLLDGPDALSSTANDDLHEELGIINTVTTDIKWKDLPG